jgi:putative flavoprotein involved in K+ transport
MSLDLTETDTLVVGAGQAGVAMSEHLGKLGIPHLVLERHRIAERWRSERWDSLVANGPAWHDRFPGMEFPGYGPDEFVTKEDVADYFVAYAKMINAPIRTWRSSAWCASRASRAFWWKPEGTIRAQRVVAATGPSSAR